MIAIIDYDVYHIYRKLVNKMFQRLSVGEKRLYELYTNNCAENAYTKNKKRDFCKVGTVA